MPYHLTSGCLERSATSGVLWHDVDSAREIVLHHQGCSPLPPYYDVYDALPARAFVYPNADSGNEAVGGHGTELVGLLVTHRPDAHASAGCGVRQGREVDGLDLASLARYRSTMWVVAREAQGVGHVLDELVGGRML